MSDKKRRGGVDKPTKDRAQVDEKAPLAQVIPFHEVKITVGRFVAGMGPLGECFATCEKMNDQVRKLPRVEWQREYEQWVSRPRG